VFPFPLLELLGRGVPEGSGIPGSVPLAEPQFEIYKLLHRLGILVGIVLLVGNPNLGGVFARTGFSGVVAGEEIGEGAAGADVTGAAAGVGGGVGGGGSGAGFGAAKGRRGRGVVAGDAGEAFAEAEGAETGDGDGGMAVAGGETVRFGSHECGMRSVGGTAIVVFVMCL